MRVKTILFDIGNVLTHDGHETYLTDPTYGLLRTSVLTTEDILEKTAPVFRKYAVIPKADAHAFWRDISEVLETSISNEDIQKVTQDIQTINPEVTKIFELLKANGIRIGIISNNTDVFYPLLAKLLNLSNFVESDLYFLSHTAGVTKSSGLFELAAGRVEPATTHIIDDRAKNVLYAQKLGFGASEYKLSSGDSLLNLVSEIISIRYEIHT